MRDIPQEVRKKVQQVMFDVTGQHGWPATSIDPIIEAAQLPIAPATEDDAEQFKKDYAKCPGKVSASEAMGVALNKFISRRNSPPKVDARREKIVEILERPGLTEQEQAKLITDALDAMKEDGQ